MQPTDHPAPAPAVEPVDLEGIKRRSDKATQGPWTADCVTGPYPHDVCLDYSVPGEGSPILLASVYHDGDDGPGCLVSPLEANANARFICNARTDIPALLALVASRDAEIAGLKAEVGRLKEIEWMYQELCK